MSFWTGYTEESKSSKAGEQAAGYPVRTSAQGKVRRSLVHG